eukprot:CAMPEP_0170199356 /NCGR_PEP_ID=MMETSP0040_2-20121228/69293_1 /TAXON_ID=641309 /ORGANISM="Lotharella oceanica, Strain CCMP622" /LENGTH=296 /DNA_ID=CAMNT_0010449465 /DNA_START=768 /DNA_END=1655 /DNA_ORIENTATION=+
MDESDGLGLGVVGYAWLQLHTRLALLFQRLEHWLASLFSAVDEGNQADQSDRDDDEDYNERDDATGEGLLFGGVVLDPHLGLGGRRGGLDAAAREEVAVVRGAEHVVRACHEPRVTVILADGHLVHLPGVVGAVVGVVDGRALGVGRVARGPTVLAVEPDVRRALVEARLLHEEALAGRGEGAAAIPMEVRTVAGLEVRGIGDLGRTAGRLFPGVAFGEIIAFRSGQSLVEELKVADAGVSVRVQRLADRVVRVHVVEEPHRVSLRIVLHHFESSAPHVFAQLGTVGVDLSEFLAA